MVSESYSLYQGYFAPKADRAFLFALLLGAAQKSMSQ